MWKLRIAESGSDPYIYSTNNLRWKANMGVRPSGWNA
ncbi:unnamed protein product [Rhodiola kirilowii]